MLRPEGDDPSSAGQPRPWAKSWTRRSTRSCWLTSLTDTVIRPPSLLPLFCSFVPWCDLYPDVTRRTEIQDGVGVPGPGTSGTVNPFRGSPKRRNQASAAAAQLGGDKPASGLPLPLGTHYRADEGTFGMMSKYLLFSHTQSSSSVSATNSQENRAVHGFLYAFASSMVT
jgi:hypothetical protein